MRFHCVVLLISVACASTRRPPEVAVVTVCPGLGDSGDRNAIRCHIRRQLTRIEQCYQWALLENPHLEGTVNTSFVIASNGGTTNVVTSGIGDRFVESCIGVLRTISFTRPPGEPIPITSYPFTFRPAP
jgi:hypothetical protein